MKPRLLTIAEAAARRGISKTRIYAAIAQKRLGRHYVKGSLAVSEADLIAWDIDRKAGGWKKGSKLTETHKQKIALGQRRRWAKKKAPPSG